MALALRNAGLRAVSSGARGSRASVVVVRAASGQINPSIKKDVEKVCVQQA